MRVKTNAPQDCSSGITLSMPWRVTEVHPKTGYRLQVRFLDGTEGEVDMSELIRSKEAGIFAVLSDQILFNKVYVELGVVTWPGEIDLAPDAMYYEIKKQGRWILR